MSQIPRPIAATEAGELEGIWSNGVAAFRGVPYAASPAGANRFRPPQPVVPWTGRRQALGHGPIPPQPRSRLERVMGPASRPMDEDCLTLTLSTPSADDAKRPVMVFLHGGAYLSGAGSLDWYDGATLAREGDVVVVGVNYRLGALGFLHHPVLAPGSAGLADMVAALAYIKRNIQAFGGDPAAVTVVGQSAGAHAIMTMLASGEARGLFQRAILQSAPAALPPLSSAAAAANATQFLALLGIDADAADADVRLAAIPADRIVETQMQFARGLARFGEVTPPFLPVADALAEPGRFRSAAAANAVAFGIDLVIGTTREEAHAFFAPDPGAPEPDPAALAALFERLTGTADGMAAYRLGRPGGGVWDLVSDLKTDHDFAFPSLDLAAAVTAAGGHAFAYQFDWAPPASPFLACHCLELPFVFGSWPAWTEAPMLAGGEPVAMAALGATFRQAWFGFARSGSPALSGLAWPVYDAGKRRTMAFGAHVGIVGDPAGLSWKPRQAI